MPYSQGDADGVLVKSSCYIKITKREKRVRRAIEEIGKLYQELGSMEFEETGK